MTNTHLIFDFDGVIVDSFDVCFAVTKMYDPEITADEYKMMFTGNIFDSIKKKGSINKSPVDFDFFYHYFQKIIDVAPINGIPEFLQQLDSKIDIVSSTDTTPIEKYLDKYNLDSYVNRILGGDVEKSKTLKLEMVKDSNPGKELIFITDTLGDILEANKLDIKCIGVTWGFHTKELLSQGNSFISVDTLEELTKVINNYPF